MLPLVWAVDVFAVENKREDDMDTSSLARHDLSTAATNFGETSASFEPSFGFQAQILMLLQNSWGRRKQRLGTGAPELFCYSRNAAACGTSLL